MSESEGNTSVNPGSGFSPLEFERLLREVQTSEVKYSRGFSAADLSRFFVGLSEHWLPFFRSTGVNVEVVACRKALYFPQELGRIVVVEVNGESAVLGIDELSQSMLAESLVPDAPTAAQEIIVEYLERRLLTTLTKCWSGSEPLLCYYLSSDWADEVEILGGIELELQMNSKKVHLWFGIGPRLLDELDRMWKRSLVKQSGAAAGAEDSVSTLSVELASLTVPPATLIDYMRAGTVIDLETEREETVTIALNGQPWANGTLCRFNGSFAIQVTDFDAAAQPISPGRTRVVIELARTDVDQNMLLEYHQPGAIVPLGRPVGPLISLVINSEHVANAFIGEVNGRLAIHVIPKQ